MRLKDWAQKEGIHYETARRWASNGTMPVPVTKTATGVWMVEDTPVEQREGKTVAYARVSSHDQKDDLTAQIGRIAEQYNNKIDLFVSEIGSGMNPGRAKINKILADPEVTTIVVEHRDRLARVNVELIESCLRAQGREIIYLNEPDETDLATDIIDFMTSACASLYGKRGAENRAKKALEATKQTEV